MPVDYFAWADIFQNSSLPVGQMSVTTGFLLFFFSFQFFMIKPKLKKDAMSGQGQMSAAKAPAFITVTLFAPLDGDSQGFQRPGFPGRAVSK